jgi:hypothetical protein
MQYSLGSRRRRVDRLLVQDGVDGDGGLAGLTVADDQLALAAADGIRASMAFRPVCIGSCTDLRGMMPGALTSTRRRSVVLDRALAVDRLAERVDDAAEQALADRHVHDAEGRLTSSPSLMARSRRRSRRRRCRARGSGPCPSRRPWGTRPFRRPGRCPDRRRGRCRRRRTAPGRRRKRQLPAEVGDLRLEDGRNFGGADVHGLYALFRANLRALEGIEPRLGLQRGVEQAGAHLAPSARPGWRDRRGS